VLRGEERRRQIGGITQVDQRVLRPAAHAVGVSSGRCRECSRRLRSAPFALRFPWNVAFSVALGLRERAEWDRDVLELPDLDVLVGVDAVTLHEVAARGDELIGLVQVERPVRA
jgi:hypothetical protein